MLGHTCKPLEFFQIKKYNINQKNDLMKMFLCMCGYFKIPLINKISCSNGKQINKRESLEGMQSPKLEMGPGSLAAVFKMKKKIDKILNRGIRNHSD